MDMKQLREKAGLRSVDVASKLGIAESTVRNWDIGRHSPQLPIEEIPKFLKVYDCTLQEAIEAAKNSRKKFEALDGDDREGQHSLTVGGRR
jgi:transcriptional regulator with XRE-family HTH domain